MIFIGCGLILMVIGILWIISPAKRPNRIYGYLSYLAQVNNDSFRFAQKRASIYFIISGLIQFLIGLIIHYFKLDNLFILWLLTFYFFIIFPIIGTEKSLKKFLISRHELPKDYVDPDNIKHEKTKGFRDL